MFAKRALRFISIVKEAPGSFAGAIIYCQYGIRLERKGLLELMHSDEIVFSPDPMATNTSFWLSELIRFALR